MGNSDRDATKVLAGAFIIFWIASALLGATLVIAVIYTLFKFAGSL